MTYDYFYVVQNSTEKAGKAKRQIKNNVITLLLVKYKILLAILEVYTNLVLLNIFSISFYLYIYSYSSKI